MSENKGEKKEIKQTVQSKPFLCARFNDGYMVVHESWIKEKTKDSLFNVYYPAKNASSLVTKATPKIKIANWDFMAAEILCAHGKVNTLKNNV